MTTVARPEPTSYELLQLDVDIPASRLVTIITRGELDRDLIVTRHLRQAPPEAELSGADRAGSSVYPWCDR